MQDRHRVRAVVRGAVQGVGFRPFVFRLATDLRLCGWVVNSAAGVVIEVEGPRQDLAAFLLRLDREKPPRAFVQSSEATFLDPVGFTTFEIRPSVSGAKTALVLPDVATCPDCLREVRDPADRRYRYPFTNCTNCGPRFTIITALPYDRPNTSMAGFTMCAACQAEYGNPRDRRFHAQPNACPACGPHLELWDRGGIVMAAHDSALDAAAGQVRAGSILALKGLGGFHLMVDARNDDGIRRLRQLKAREEKPFALMYPSLEAVAADCEVSEIEARLLASAESPIVLLRRRSAGHSRLPDRHGAIAASVAPGNPYLGVMLPYTPLHHLLMSDLGFPVVATSGNVSDEPICTDAHEALERLGAMADVFLVHDRPIVRHADDSIVRVVLGRELAMLRRMLARGVHTPKTSSAGRLFDAIASLSGLRQRLRHEGQAAMDLEFALDGVATDEAYPFALQAGNPAVVDWAPLVAAVLDDARAGVAAGLVSARFHNALAEIIVAVARLDGADRVALTGGCFQNRYLTERAVARLAAEGFRPYWHQRIPPNDGGIALGQLVAVTRHGQWVVDSG